MKRKMKSLRNRQKKVWTKEHQTRESLKRFQREGKQRSLSLRNWLAGERDPVSKKIRLNLRLKEEWKILWSHTLVLGKDPDLAGKAARVGPPTRLMIPEESERWKLFLMDGNLDRAEVRTFQRDGGRLTRLMSLCQMFGRQECWHLA